MKTKHLQRQSEACAIGYCGMICGIFLFLSGLIVFWRSHSFNSKVAAGDIGPVDEAFYMLSMMELYAGIVGLFGVVFTYFFYSLRVRLHHVQTVETCQPDSKAVCPSN